MPAYYSIAQVNLSTTTSDTEDTRITTGAAKSARIMAFYGANRSSTAGGVQLRIKNWFTTAATAGTATTPKLRALGQTAAAATCGVGTITVGTGGPDVILDFGCPQIGGMGGWYAIEADAGVQLVAGGGVNGSVTMFTQSTSTNTSTFDKTIEFYEG